MKKDKFLEKILNTKSKHQKEMSDIVVNALQEGEALVQKLQSEEANVKPKFPERVSDAIASFGGSWPFIIVFFLFIAFWMIINLDDEKGNFDPYPFILLNLILSCLAAVQAPIILMSQNRKEKRDRARAEDDYLINLKAELESRLTNKKLDFLINEQINHLTEIQEFQIERMNNILTQMKKVAGYNKNKMPSVDKKTQDAKNPPI